MRIPGRLATALLLLALAGCTRGHDGLALPPKGDAGTDRDRELVVLVHGLGRSKLSMLPLEWVLEREGYEVLNWGYSSFCCTVSELAERLAAEVDGHLETTAHRVHFVGHSLGGIIIRSMMLSDPPADIGRVVLLAPPNGGSPLADRYAPALGWILRPLPELVRDEESTVRSLPTLEHADVGVIAGEFDGKVRVTESHLKGEADHVIVPSGHTFIMTRADVWQLILTFLRAGRFSDPPRGPPAA